MAVVVLVTMFVTIPATVAATAAIVGDYTPSMPYVQAVIAGTALTCAGAVRMRRRSAGPGISIRFQTDDWEPAFRIGYGLCSQLTQQHQIGLAVW
jgi:hypothetical protein